MSNPRRRHLLSVLAALPYRRIRRREPRPPRARPPTMIVWPFSSPYAPRRSFASSSMAVVPPAAIPLPSRLPRRDNQMTEIRMRRALGRSWGRRVVGRCGMRWPGTGRVRAVRPTARLVLRDRVCHGPTMSVWSCRGAGPCGVSGLPRLSPGMGTSQGPGARCSRRREAAHVPCRAVHEPCARGGGDIVL